MNYNDRVAKAQISAKKREAVTENLLEYSKVRRQFIDEIKTRRLQFAYGRFLENPVWTKKRFMKETKISEHVTDDIFKSLENMGLIGFRISDSSTYSKEYYLISDKNIPEGWPAKGELIMMENSYTMDRKNVVVKKPTTDEKTENEIVNNPLTMMLRNPDYHAMNGVDGYVKLMKDTAKSYGNEEIDRLVEAIHKVCILRIEQQYVECPICRGRIQRNRNQARCTGCGIMLEAETFAQTMDCLKILAKKGVKMT